MKRTLWTLGLVGLSLALTAEAKAQLPGQSVVYETVSPGQRNVSFGEQYVVKRRPFKTVIRQRPVRYVTTTPPVVTETRVIAPAQVYQQGVIQSPAALETRYLQPSTVYAPRVYAPNPVIQTRYAGPYPY